MRRIVLLALSLLVVSAAQAANGSWADPAGDAGGAPDVTQVRATTEGGRATFTIVTTSAASWENAVAFVRIDAQPGGDANFVDDTLTLHSNHDLVTHEHWDGSRWSIVSPSQATFSLDGLDVDAERAARRARLPCALHLLGRDRRPDRPRHRAEHRRLDSSNGTGAALRARAARARARLRRHRRDDLQGDASRQAPVGRLPLGDSGEGARRDARRRRERRTYRFRVR